MNKETTPPQTDVPKPHEPPSLPTSPLPKRTKTDTMTASNGTDTAVTSIQQPLPPLLVKKLVDSARAPTRGSTFAAGYDLYAAKETVIPAKGKAMVDTGIAIAVPEGTCTFSLFVLSQLMKSDKKQMVASHRAVALHRSISSTLVLVSLMLTTVARSRCFCSISLTLIFPVCLPSPFLYPWLNVR